jgi:predicted AAA+ superfamily ATPase
MISRLIAHQLRDRLRHSPAVALLGPRQCGKTTLARSLGGLYFDLEEEADRLRLDLQWESLVSSSKMVILDEAQTFPPVFPRLRGAIDRQRQAMGRFLLLGSVSPSLMRQVSESLAGRLSLVELTPFLFPELSQKSMDSLWLRGGFPDGGIRDPDRFPRWQQDYLTLLMQRDLPAWGLAAKPQVTRRFLQMLAAVHGQAWNASRVGQSLGLSHPTINSYLDYMEGTFLVRRLSPWLPNVRKRLIRSPKCYWRDHGLLHALLGVRNADELLSQPWVGASWEGFVIEQILATLSARGLDFEPHFFRTSDGYEVDLVLVRGKPRWAIEIKLTSQPSSEDFGRLDHAADLIGAENRALISRTPNPISEGKRLSCSLPHFLEKVVVGM